MDAQAGMLAKLFERSMGLGPEWEVSDVWLEERGGAPDELQVPSSIFRKCLLTPYVGRTWCDVAIPCSRSSRPSGPAG